MISISKVAKVIELVKEREDASDESRKELINQLLTIELNFRSYEELLDLLTIRYLGCCKDCNKNDYATNFGDYKSRIGCYDYSKNSAIDSLIMVGEIPLGESLTMVSTLFPAQFNILYFKKYLAKPT